MSLHLMLISMRKPEDAYDNHSKQKHPRTEALEVPCNGVMNSHIATDYTRFKAASIVSRWSPYELRVGERLRRHAKLFPVGNKSPPTESPPPLKESPERSEWERSGDPCRRRRQEG